MFIVEFHYHSSGLVTDQWFRSADIAGTFDTAEQAVIAVWRAKGSGYGSYHLYRVVNGRGTIVANFSPMGAVVLYGQDFLYPPNIQTIDSNYFADFIASSQETPMPSFATSAIAPTVDTSVANPSTPLVEVAVRRNKPDNRLVLTINAKELHSRLDEMGAPVVGNAYDDQPISTFSIVSGDSLSPKLFLKREYPVTVNLSGVFSSPPTPQRLAAICNSSFDVVRNILLHYQPIDIKVTLLKQPLR